ncbi:hypothetical protein D9611_012913 [Ephemerocybe angulata]|uniref:Reverse transcriptase domain-containing protein n=1 Tax=Ephemerocybe angulata TaxID=980116 RepID=A0A8H5FFR5_9AGAR|nr:hypothetical protein D9611_012913 [Tulosesus angulatus]
MGGVALIYRSHLNVAIRRDLTLPDILVIESDDFLVVSAYILPETTRDDIWEQWTETHPFDSLVSLLALLAENPKPVLVIGDFNARIGSLSASAETDRPFTCDRDTVTTRGRALHRHCVDNRWLILNGCEVYGADGGRYTSYQGRGSTVIDYAVVNASAQVEGAITHFSVSQHRPHISDHAAICVSLATLADTRPSLRTPHHEMGEDDVIPLLKPIDHMLAAALESQCDHTSQTALIKLYGISAMRRNLNPIEIYADGACFNNGRKNARAGSGAYWGEGCGRNISARVPDEQTNNRGELFAVLGVLLTESPQHTLHIYSDSEYVMESLITRGAQNAARGWDMINGDLFRDIANLLKHRPAPVKFIQVKGHIGLKPHDMADSLAKDGALLPEVTPYTPLSDDDISALMPVSSYTIPGDAQLMLVAHPKITYLPMEKLRLEGREDEPVFADSESDYSSDSEWDSDSSETVVPRNSHRSRGLVYASRKSYKTRLHSAKTERAMWKIVHEMLCAWRALDIMPVIRLFVSFRLRMNPSFPMPLAYNEHVLLCQKIASDSMPLRTTDTTVEQIFSSPITVDEIAAAKAHIHKQATESSASGLDGVGYDNLMAIDNEVLARVFNECLDTLEVPTQWLTTVLAAILKKGKARDDPDGYRAIALESCGLKFMTLLIHKRLTRWCERHNIIPDSQNGFREGYRTNNNVFVLRTAVERARAEGKTLYVAFADLSNAFPATNHACLWTKLQRLGAGGKIFDWLRLLYREMTYVVSHGGEMSEEFQAAMGILAGDTSSPILWTIYLSDLIFEQCRDDIRLSGTPISSLEQADDIILMSTSPEGLQRKMRTLFIWCAANAMMANATKSAVLIFGTRRPGLGPFYFGDETVEVKTQQTYVGICIRTDKRDIFCDHYTSKSAKATTVGNMVLGLHKMLGSLDPWDARKLYMGLVDPHLTHGCEVIIDTAPSAKSLAQLESVFNRLIRRFLGLHARAFVAVLSSEMGIIPLRYRRLLIALGFLLYLLRLPDHRYAKLALRDSIDLLASGKSGWFSDLLHSLQTLPIPVNVPDPLRIDVDMVEDIRERVRASMTAFIIQETNRISSLYLLKDRLEPGERGGDPPRVIPIKFRHYLSVITYRKDRVALTKILTGCHELAVERLKWARNADGEKVFDRLQRLCRFCKHKAESPEHALLECNACPDLVSARRQFWAKMHELPAQPLPPLVLHAPTLVKQLQAIVSHRPATRLIARLASQSLEIYNARPMYIPDAGPGPP